MRSWTNFLHKIDNSITPDTLMQAVNNLPKQQLSVLKKHYGEQRSFRFIASECNIPVSKVSGVHAHALYSLRMLLSAAYKEQLQQAVSKVIITNGSAKIATGSKPPIPMTSK